MQKSIDENTHFFMPMKILPTFLYSERKELKYTSAYDLYSGY